MTIAITDVVLRDAHQSLFATRLRLDDMLPIAAQLDDVGYGSLECWGGATFDACIRFLGEDPWVRLRELKKAMPKTPLQMLLRGQNLLGYRHYADDVVERFVERAVKNGMDVFRVFDAMNDPRNMKAALQAVRSHGAHAQGTLSYTTSPAHTLQTWLDLTEQLLETGVDSIAIKDMSGILTPMAAYELVSEIKKRFEVRLHLHCHATTGMADPAGHPDLADCRHPGGAQRPDRRALQDHREGNRRDTEGRVRPHAGAGERRVTGPRAGRGRSGDLPSGGFTQTGTG